METYGTVRLDVEIEINATMKGKISKAAFLAKISKAMEQAKIEFLEDANIDIDDVLVTIGDSSELLELGENN